MLCGVPEEGPRWLLLVHQIPPAPGYLRVKIGRRLQGLGAVPLKNSVYVLPRSDEWLEDFQWVRREIVAGGGEAFVSEASFVEGLTDEAIESLFNTARRADYAALAGEVRKLRSAKGGRKATSARESAAVGLARLRRKLEEVMAIDFFGADGREAVQEELAALSARLRGSDSRDPAPERAVGDVRGRTWVTRSGVKVDRIASAWLIRRFIDPQARFKFVRGQAYQPQEGELRFDMFEAEFTHEGDRCTFEVLVDRFGLADRALRQVAEIVHDVDLKDGRFGRPEAMGVERLVAGIAARHAQDDARIADGATVLEALYESFRK